MEQGVVKQRIRWLVAGAVALWLSSMFFTVNQEEYAVVLLFGKPVREIEEPGLKLKLPLPINTVARVDKRLLMYDTIATEYLTRDKKNIIAQAYTVWRVNDPIQLLRRCGDRLSAEQKLDEHLSSVIGAEFGKYEFDNLVNTDPEAVQVGQVMEAVRDGVNQTVSDRQYGIEVVDVQLTKLSYPDATQESVFRRMRTERKAIAEAYRAEGNREATRIRSQADRDKARILAEAQQKADAIRGEAEREAARIFAAAYAGNPGFWRYWRKLQAMEKVIDKQTVVYMTPDIELFSPLTSVPGQ